MRRSRLRAGATRTLPGWRWQLHRAWGVHQLQVDRDALANNTLRILKLSLRFQDGELYDAPGADELPDPVDLSQLLQSQQTVTYYAALPAFKPFGGNFGPSGQAMSSA